MQDSERILQAPGEPGDRDPEPRAGAGADQQQEPDADPVVEWLLRHRLDEHLTDGSAAKLLRWLGQRPTADQVAQLRRWCPSVERLSRWCARVRRWYQPRDLGAYLLRACRRGDPGTALAATGGERLQDLPQRAEQALVGPHQAAVGNILRAGVGVLGQESPARKRARLQIMIALESQRPDVAARHIRAILGDAPTDAALADLLDGICDPARGRQLLEVPA